MPLAADHSIGIAIVSYDGKVFFGINADASVDAQMNMLRDRHGQLALELTEARADRRGPPPASPEYGPART